MKKILALVLALLMVCVVFVSCGEPAETKGAETTAAGTKEETGRAAQKDNVPLDLSYANLEDNTVTFFVRNNSKTYEYELACEDLQNDTLYDAIHYRNIDVEKRLGVKIKSLAQNGAYGVYKDWFQTLSTAVLNNTGDYDGAGVYVNMGAGYALDGIYYNLTKLTTENGGYLDLEQPWWNHSLIDSATVYDKLFFVGGDIAISELSGCHCLFFNKNLFAQKFPDDVKQDPEILYNLVKNKKWTIDKMTSYVSAVWDDVNNDGEISDGDVVGLKNYFNARSAELDSWVYALGVELTSRNIFGEVEITANSSTRIVPAYEKFLQLYNSTGTLKSPEGKVANETTNMVAGNCLFFEVGLSDGGSMRESSVKYGVLPLPKFDEEQENYANSTSTNASVITICSNLKEDRAKMMSAILELLAAESYKQVTTAYYSNVVTGVYSKDEIDAQMFDIVIDTVVMPFEFVYNQKLSGLGNIFRSFDRDMQNYLDGKREAWPTALESLLTAIEEMED